MFRRGILPAIAVLLVAGFGAPAAQAASSLTAPRFAVPNDAEVYVRYVNETDREVRFMTWWGRSGDIETTIVLEPGQQEVYWGSASGAGPDLSAWLSYCTDQATWDPNCDVRRNHLAWKNPIIGWPWMSEKHGTDAGDIHETVVRFAAGESHSWRPYSEGRITITGTRLTDADSGTKRFTVRITNRH